MSESNKTQELLKKLTPCIERSGLEACVEEAARLAQEMGIGAKELLEFSDTQEYKEDNHKFAYVYALAAAKGLKEKETARAYFIAGRAADNIGILKEAEEHYKKAIEAEPKHALAHNNYAILLQKQKRYEEAEEHYKNAIEAEPKHETAHNNYAILLTELNRKDEAEEHYKKAIEIKPKYAFAHNNYANLLNKLNRKDEAEEHYKKAIEINLKYAEAHSNYANLLTELNRKDEAEEHYKKAIEIKPKYAEAHSNYAILLNKLNRKDEAEEHYKKAIEINPKDALAHNNYANLLREKALFCEAEKEVRTALNHEKDNPYALGTLGDILSDEGYFEEAKIEYQNALEKVSKNPDSMKRSEISEITSNLGRVYGELKQYDKAKEEFQKAILLDPMNVKAIRNLRKLRKAEVEPEISESQMEIGGLLFLGLLISFGLFWIKRLSETVFTTQAIFLVASIIFVLFFHQIKKFKAGTIEFETSTGFIDGKPSFET